MTFLPIVERELRVASRKRNTFWLRLVAALVGLVIGCGFLALTNVGWFGFGGATLGRSLFAVLTWLSLAAALSAGLFLTSDCLSEEKREGTLGFLFLTDLRSYDVVLGKLLTTSLRGFYALLALFPILAVNLLMGGVTGMQFWKTVLALVNALFISLVAGLFISAISRQSQKALAATLLLLLLLVAGGPAGDAAFAAVKERNFHAVLSLSSPGYLLVTADAWGRTHFWPGLLANQAIAWILLCLTCVLLPRTWQEKAAKTSRGIGSWEQWLKFGGAKSRGILRQKLVGVNPVFWLACRERWQAILLFVVAILVVGGLIAIFPITQPELWFVWNSFAGPFLTWVFYLVIASQAGRFLVEAKRSGLIELLLVTPLTIKQIVQGQWRALLRMFGAPLALCLAAQLYGTFLVQQMTWNGLAANSRATPAVATTVNTTTNPPSNMTTNAPRRMTVTTVTPNVTGRITVTVPGGGFATSSDFVALAIAVAGSVTVVTNLAALVWFGMWMGLNSKNTNLATLKTIVFIQVIPWFVVSFTVAMVVPLLLPKLMALPTAASQMMAWYPLLTSALATVLYLTKDVVFSLWARRKLYSEFRTRAAQTGMTT